MGKHSLHYLFKNYGIINLLALLLLVYDARMVQGSLLPKRLCLRLKRPVSPSGRTSQRHFMRPQKEDQKPSNRVLNFNALASNEPLSIANGDLHATFRPIRDNPHWTVPQATLPVTDKGPTTVRPKTVSPPLTTLGTNTHSSATFTYPNEIYVDTTTTPDHFLQEDTIVEESNPNPFERITRQTWTSQDMDTVITANKAITGQIMKHGIPRLLKEYSDSLGNNHKESFSLEGFAKYLVAESKSGPMKEIVAVVALVRAVGQHLNNYPATIGKGL